MMPGVIKWRSDLFYTKRKLLKVFVKAFLT